MPTVLRNLRAQWSKLGIVVLVVILAGVTGWTRSPLIFLLYLPILLAALRSRALIGLIIGLVISAVYMAGAYYRNPIINTADTVIVGVALSFPAVAVYTIYLNKRMEERVHLLTSRTHELKALLDMSQMMDSAFDLDMTLNLVLLNAHETAGCQVCAVYLKNETGDSLELKGASGPRDRVSLLPTIAIDEAACGDWSVDTPPDPGQNVHSFYVAETARHAESRGPGMLTRDSLGDSRLFDLDPRARSFACLPLTSVEGLLGMLYVGYDVPNGLADVDLARLENLATRAAFPLQRVLLQQGFQSLAFSDSKTGLDNFRQFELNLKNELTRAERYGHRLSVILLDIDFFKQFNDNHGHPAGDAVLAQVAMILRNSLRSPDKPARYGGEEFVIICPETGKEEARLISERIRKNIAETEFAVVTGTGEAGVSSSSNRVTVSIGFATFPQDARQASDLTQKADDALYAAKRAGRNAVRGYEDISSRLMVL